MGGGEQVSLHGSWYPSQFAHFVETFLFTLAGFAVLGGLAGAAWTGLVFTLGKEGPQIYPKIISREWRPILGDFIDLGIHVAGLVAALLVAGAWL